MSIKESTHYYSREGQPKYQVPYADPSKGMRNTTLRDAKKEGFVPSVTAILNVPAKPGLDRWKQNQTLKAAYAFPAEESFDEWSRKVQEKASEIGSETASIGTAIHANIEQYYISGEIMSEEYRPHVENVVAEMKKYYPEGFVAESAFSHPLGYGGKVDLSVQSEEIQKGIVFDFKSKDFNEDKKAKDLAFPEMAMQLDAYRNGLEMPEAQMISVFIDRATGLVKTFEWPEGNYFEQFKCLLKYWQLSKGYDSSF